MRTFFFLFLLAFGNSAFAEDFYWTGSSTYLGSTHYPSASAVCDAYVQWYNNVNAGSRTYSYQMTFSSDTLVQCGLHFQVSGSTADNFDRYLPASRSGTSCPAGSTYNPATGACDSDNRCLLAKGASTTYYVKTQLSSSPPDQVDIGGCLAKFGGVITCRNTSNGFGVCTGTATITGEQTTATSPVAGTGTECSGTSCQSESPKTEKSEFPCEYSTDPATGVRVCTSETHFSEPGTSTCQSGGGALVCVEEPKSRSQDKTTNSKIEDSTNPDGSTTSKTTTTTSTSSCLGINNCTSTSSTETSTGGTNPDGSPKPSTSSCTGDGCAAPEDAPKEEEPKPSVSGEDCKAPLMCEGDAITCAILRQSKELKCHEEEQDDYAAHKSEIDALFADPKFHADADTEVPIPDFINEGTRFMDPSCPGPQQFTVGGRAFALQFTPLCNAADSMSPLFVMVAALSAALYIGKGLGGS